LTNSNPNLFVKTIDLARGDLAYRIEKEKARRMTEIFLGEADYTTPPLLDVDDSRGLLIFQRKSPTRQFTAREEISWFARAGRALAIVHSRLTLPDDLTIVRAADRDRRGRVFVHGDYMPNNLGISNDQLILFDWGLRPWTEETYTCAAGSVDVAAFLGPWLVPRWGDLRFPIAKLAAMMEGYVKGLGENSIVADLTLGTLQQEMIEQYLYAQQSIGRRSLWRRPIADLKLRLNRSRLESLLGRRISDQATFLFPS
jgi:hypothetical protein